MEGFYPEIDALNRQPIMRTYEATDHVNMTIAGETFLEDPP